MSENTEVAKTDIVANLVAVTGKRKEELRLAAMSLLPKEVRGTYENLAAFVMRCRSVGVDPFGEGVYAAMMKGTMKVMLHYNTYIGLALKTDLIGRGDWNVECVYEGEKFSFTPHTVDHEMNHTKRHGIPIGAYAMGRAKDMKEPLCIYISYKDFARNADSASSAWRACAYEMTTKAAIKILFKRLFPDVYAGVNMEGDFGEEAPIRAEITEAEKATLVDDIFTKTEPPDVDVETPADIADAHLDEANAEMDAAEKEAIERDEAKEESEESKGAAQRDKDAAKKEGRML